MPVKHMLSFYDVDEKLSKSAIFGRHFGDVGTSIKILK